MSYSLSVNTLSNLFPPDSGVAARVGDQLAPSLQAYLTQSGGIDVWVDDVLHTGQPISGASVVRIGRCKANRQYLLTLQVSRYCILALQSSALLSFYVRLNLALLVALHCQLQTNRPLGYDRVFLPLCKVPDTPFHIQRNEIIIILTSLRAGHGGGLFKICV